MKVPIILPLNLTLVLGTNRCGQFVVGTVVKGAECGVVVMMMMMMMMAQLE